MKAPRHTRSPLPGTRPAGAHDEDEAAARVREMFSRIAPRYDFLNHLLSFSFDRVWRRRTARRFGHILVRPEARVLDLCCGTGDLALALAREAGKTAARQGGKEGARVWGCDFAHPMLVLARKKIREKEQGRESSLIRGRTQKAASVPDGLSGGHPLPSLPRYLEGDALNLPFADASFYLVASAFGFRNLANYESGLREIYRILMPGGEVGILEFAEPRPLLIAPFYRFYFNKILPRIGGAISRSPATYAYLPSSVAKFTSPQELLRLMERVGFANARFELWTAGIVTLHIGRKP